MGLIYYYFTRFFSQLFPPPHPTPPPSLSFFSFFFFFFGGGAEWGGAEIKKEYCKFVQIWDWQTVSIVMTRFVVVGIKFIIGC